MPRRSILSAAERESLLALPDTKDELIRHYTFSESDLSIIRQRRGPANRLGFAVQLCYLRFPGVILGADEPPFPPLLRLVANQLKVGIESWDEYGQREQTRREHLVELQTVFGFQPFTIGHYRQAVQLLTELAMQTDKGIVLARALIEHLRRQSVIVPALNAVERASAEAITRANRRLYDALAEPLTDVHRRRLDDLLKRRDNGKTTWLAWLRQSPVKPNSRHMLEHIERLKAWQALDLPSGIERLVHQNRLLKIAREGGQMTPADLAKFEPQRRYATLVALAIEGMATVTDEIIDLHDRIRASCSMPPRTSISSSSGIRQGDQCQGAAVRAHRPGADRGQASGPRSVRRHRGRHVLGCFRRERHRSAAARATRGLRFPAPHRRELRHAAPLRAGISRRAQVAGRARRQGRTRRHRGAAQHEQRQRPQGAHRRADRVHQAALAEAGDDRHRHRPALLRTVRAVGAEERAALRRHLGARLAPVQGLRGLPGAAREIRQPQAGQRIAAGRGHRLRPVPA
ncbi:MULTISPECIES: DUF4158 domain-containing protein [Enterobacter cloacae complex]